MYANKPPTERSTYCTYYLECRLEEAMQHIQNLYAKKLKDDGEKELLEKLVEGLPKIMQSYEFSCILDYQRFLLFIAKHKMLVDIFRNKKQVEPVTEPELNKPKSTLDLGLFEQEARAMSGGSFNEPEPTPYKESR